MYVNFGIALLGNSLKGIVKISMYNSGGSFGVIVFRHSLSTHKCDMVAHFSFANWRKVCCSFELSSMIQAVIFDSFENSVHEFVYSDANRIVTLKCGEIVRATLTCSFTLYRNTMQMSVGGIPITDWQQTDDIRCNFISDTSSSSRRIECDTTRTLA